MLRYFRKAGISSCRLSKTFSHNGILGLLPIPCSLSPASAFTNVCIKNSSIFNHRCDYLNIFWSPTALTKSHPINLHWAPSLKWRCFYCSLHLWPYICHENKICTAVFLDGYSSCLLLCFSNLSPCEIVTRLHLGRKNKTYIL